MTSPQTCWLSLPGLGVKLLHWAPKWGLTSDLVLRCSLVFCFFGRSEMWWSMQIWEARSASDIMKRERWEKLIHSGNFLHTSPVGVHQQGGGLCRLSSHTADLTWETETEGMHSRGRGGGRYGCWVGHAFPTTSLSERTLERWAMLGCGVWVCLCTGRCMPLFAVACGARKSSADAASGPGEDPQMDFWNLFQEGQSRFLSWRIWWDQTTKSSSSSCHCCWFF